MILFLFFAMLTNGQQNPMGSSYVPTSVAPNAPPSSQVIFAPGAPVVFITGQPVVFL